MMDGADPYRSFKFHLCWNGKTVARFSQVTGLAKSVEADRRGAGVKGPKRIPGQTSFEPITLERGLTQDKKFEEWTNYVWVGKTSKTTDVRRDFKLEVYSENGQVVLSYSLFRCWPSEFISIPNLDEPKNGLAIETLKLENEGWERMGS